MMPTVAGEFKLGPSVLFGLRGRSILDFFGPKAWALRAMPTICVLLSFVLLLTSGPYD
jgi:hypothetical protein